jgi:hypothetical protein
MEQVRVWQMNLAVGEALLVAPFSSAGEQVHAFAEAQEASPAKPRGATRHVLHAQGITRPREGGMQDHREGRLMQQEARHRREGRERRRGREGKPLADKAKEVVGAREARRSS